MIRAERFTTEALVHLDYSLHCIHDHEISRDGFSLDEDNAVNRRRKSRTRDIQCQS